MSRLSSSQLLLKTGLAIAVMCAATLPVRAQTVPAIKVLINNQGAPQVTGYSGDGGLAASAKINNPRGGAVDSKGNVFFVDAGNKAVRRIDKATGLISTMVGGASASNTCPANGTPGVQALLVDMVGMAITPSDSLLIATGSGGQVLELKADNNLYVVAGKCGQTTMSGDGGLAVNATFGYGVRFVSAAFDGTIYVGQGGYRIRKISDGIITAFAGSMNQYGGSLNAAGSAGDGGPALQAGIAPSAVKVAKDGTVFVTTGRENTIWAIDTNNVARIVAGKVSYLPAGYLGGESGTTPDGALARGGPVTNPRGLAIGTDMSVYFIEMGAGTATPKLRKIKPDGTLVTVLQTVPVAGTFSYGLIQGNSNDIYIPSGGPGSTPQLNQLSLLESPASPYDVPGSGVRWVPELVVLGPNDGIAVTARTAPTGCTDDCPDWGLITLGSSTAEGNALLARLQVGSKVTSEIGDGLLFEVTAILARTANSVQVRAGELSATSLIRDGEITFDAAANQRMIAEMKAYSDSYQTNALLQQELFESVAAYVARQNPGYEIQNEDGARALTLPGGAYIHLLAGPDSTGTRLEIGIKMGGFRIGMGASDTNMQSAYTQNKWLSGERAITSRDLSKMGINANRKWGATGANIRIPVTFNQIEIKRIIDWTGLTLKKVAYSKPKPGAVGRRAPSVDHFKGTIYSQTDVAINITVSASGAGVSEHDIGFEKQLFLKVGVVPIPYTIFAGIRVGAEVSGSIGKLRYGVRLFGPENRYTYNNITGPDVVGLGALLAVDPTSILSIGRVRAESFGPVDFDLTSVSARAGLYAGPLLMLNIGRIAGKVNGPRAGQILQTVEPPINKGILKLALFGRFNMPKFEITGVTQVAANNSTRVITAPKMTATPFSVQFTSWAHSPVLTSLFPHTAPFLSASSPEVASGVLDCMSYDVNQWTRRDRVLWRVTPADTGFCKWR